MSKSPLWKVLLPLFAIQYFAWTGMFALWVYTTPVIIRRFAPGAAADSPDAISVVTKVGLCFALYALLAAILNFGHDAVYRRIGRHSAYWVALACGSVGLALVPHASGLTLLLLAFGLIGIAWSAIGTIPYAIVGELAPPGKERRLMNILGFSVVVPQAVGALLLGFATRTLFGGQPERTIELGAASMAIAALLALVTRTGREDAT